LVKIIVVYKNVVIEFLDNINVISLQRREDRKQKIIEKFENIGLSFNFFNAIDGNNIENPQMKNVYAEACKKSHLNLLQQQINNQSPYYCVFEDDVVFEDDFLTSFQKLKFPYDFGIIYLGANVTGPKTRYSDRVYYADGVSTTHAMIISCKYYHAIQQVAEMYQTEPIDLILGYHCKFYPKVVVYPSLCYQDEDYSNIQQKMVNYYEIKK